MDSFSRQGGACLSFQPLRTDEGDSGFVWEAISSIVRTNRPILSNLSFICSTRLAARFMVSRNRSIVSILTLISSQTAEYVTVSSIFLDASYLLCPQKPRLLFAFRAGQSLVLLPIFRGLRAIEIRPRRCGPRCDGCCKVAR